MEKKLHNDEWTTDTIGSLIEKMKADGLVFSEISLEYRTKNNWVVVNANGRESAGISDSYYKLIQTQLTKVHNTIFKDFINFTEEQSALTIKVDEKGNFDLNAIEMVIHIPLAYSNNAELTLRKPLRKFLPFLEHITELEAKGRNHGLTVLHCSMRLSEEDFYIVMEDPTIIHPKAKLEWFSMCSVLFMKAKETYSFEQRIPCFQGELVWDNKNVTIKHTIRKSS